jgi:NifU-like protein involved in Fe-S cluster formation
VTHSPYQDHFLNPRGQGVLASATHRASVTDSACGDELTLDLAVAGVRIEAASFRVRGCSGAIAAGSALVSLLPGRPAVASAVTRNDLIEVLAGVPQAKGHALRLAIRALAVALQGTSSIT